MDPIVASALIAGGSRLVGSFLQSRQQKRNINRTFQEQVRLQDRQFSKDVEMWNMMKNYNLPKAQMERFKSAGLNPNLIYGQGTPGNVQSSPTYQAPSVDFRGIPSVAGNVMGNVVGTAKDILQIQQSKNTLDMAQVDLWIKENTKWDSVQQIKSMSGTQQYSEIIRRYEARIQSVKAKYWDAGLSPSDAIWIRVGYNALKALGVSEKKLNAIIGDLPTKALKQVMEN